MGMLRGIYVADRAGVPLRSVENAELVAGRGIVGDRYHDGHGKFSKPEPMPDREVTLIEIEQIERFNAEQHLALGAGEFRRNLVVQGVDLNALVGRELAIGDVVLRGIRLCEPCDYLASLTGVDVIKPLRHRAGLRAAIVSGGTIAVGGPISIPASVTLG
jgi:MOSC domain-containing protein YiiM